MRDDCQKETTENVAVSLSSDEVISRYGDAGAEYVKGYSGVDQQTGQIFNRGHKEIFKYKLNPDVPLKTVKQQAGFNAEVAKTSRDNAHNIIEKRKIRTVRSEDAGYGINHPVYDHVELRNGVVVDGSGSQMKFVNAADNLCDKIAMGEGGGKTDLSRYQGAKLDLPSEQVEVAQQHCQKQAISLRRQADYLEKADKLELAARKRKQAANFDQLSSDIRDSGLTTQEAVFYRKHPKIATARDMSKTSHQAGLQVAKSAAVVGGSISLIQNTLAVIQDNKELEHALKDTAKDTAKAVGVGYATGVVGSAMKGTMQQSRTSSVRALSKSNLPALAVISCLEAGKSIHHYVSGEIDGVELAEELGEKGTSMLAGGMGATIGQLAIPIPVAGAVIGGMIGYTLSSIFYSEALSAFKQEKESEANYQRIKAIYEVACAEMEAYRQDMVKIFTEQFKASEQFFNQSLSGLECAIESGDIESFAVNANQFAEKIGRTLNYGTFGEFDSVMLNEEIVVI